MKRKIARMGGLAVATATFAILTGQLTNAQQQAPGAATSADQQVTVTGCIQREADYRKSTAAGRGGAVGTGVGVGNEFVLTSAMMSPAASPSATGAGERAATGTTGAASTAYELTGANEGQAASHVGKHVEITGTLKAMTSTSAGGPTANVPGSQDLKLRELEVSSIRESSGTCSTTP